MLGNTYVMKIEVNMENTKHKYERKHVDNVYLTEYQFGMTVNESLLYFIILFV